jgi:hypothetical protein
MKRFKLEDLPKSMQDQARNILAGYDKPMITTHHPIPPAKPTKPMKLPNKTEAEYARIHLTGRNAVYEGHTFKMANGHAYTPDFAVYDDAGVLIEAHEVKGGWAQFSEQRARLAWDQSRIEFPHVKFVWARKHDEKGWQIK